MIFFCIALILKPSIIISLIKNIKQKYIGIYPSEDKQNNTEFVKILSAIGSQNFPKLDIQLYLRDKYPSKKSLMQAITKNITPINKFKSNEIVTLSILKW